MESIKYIGELVDSGGSPQNRVLVGIPMTGLLRSEWVMARYGQNIPCNWSQQSVTIWLDQYSPLRFSVPDARNMIATRAVEMDFEWVFFLDHDVILPPDALVKLNEYMLEAKVPIVNGLYFVKSKPSSPLIYRGMGTTYFDKWKLGDKVWATGAGLGCTLIHVSLLKAIYSESEEYMCRGLKVRRIFYNPCSTRYDQEKKIIESLTGTEDLVFYQNLKKREMYRKAGWPEFQKKENPILVDTGIFCKHIDWNGVQYPYAADLTRYLPPAPKVTRGRG